MNRTLDQPSQHRLPGAAATLTIVFSTLLNLYYIVRWISIFNRFDTQAERVNQFLKGFPFDLSVLAFNAFLFSLTVLSVLLLLFILKKQKYWVWLLPVQLIFAVLYIWQSL